MTRTLIIGDVHGCSQELAELLVTLQFSERASVDDRLVFVGDLVDKGPDSAGVVRHVRLLREKGYDVTLVEGNHEEGLKRWLTKDAAGRAKMKRDALYASYADDLDAADLDLLASAVPYLKLPEHNVLVTHAGVPFELAELPDDARETASWSRKQRKYIDRMCRIRYVDADWKFVSLHDVEPHHTYWAEGYDGRFGTVVYGHEPYLKPSPLVHVPEHAYGASSNIATSFRRGIGRPFQRAIGIDLGCVFGGHLCALVLDGEQRSIVTVQSHQEYAEPLYASTNLFTHD